MKFICIWIKQTFANSVFIIIYLSISFVYEVCQQILQMSGILLNGTVYDFLVDNSGTEKENVLNIFEYLLKENNLK